MIQTLDIHPLDAESLQELAYVWNENGYVKDELVEISEAEAQAFANATDELYDMYVEAAEYVIENDLFFELGIPFNLVETIKKSWENDVHWHIYGRFDYAGGLDTKAIKLLGFKADTADNLFETAVLQWAMLKFNELDETKQFNNVYEAISDNFKRLITLFEDTEKFEELYDGWKILFSCEEGNDEKEVTTKLLRNMAEDAGFETGFSFLQDVEFDDESICDKESLEYEYWFKMFKWTEISIQEGSLALTLEKVMSNQVAIILNPAYTILFESKAMMKILKDMYPDSPYLLDTSYEPFEGASYVEYKAFSEDRQNIKIFNADGSVEAENGGEYEQYKSVYQKRADDSIDESGLYRASVFFAYEACGLGFIRAKDELDADTKFIGHLIK